MVPSLRRAFINAIEASASKAGTLASIEEAIRTSSVTQVLRALQLDVVRDDLGLRLASGEFTAALTTTFNDAGSRVMPAVLQQLRRQATVPFEMSFNIALPRSAEFLRAYTGNLIREVTGEQARTMIDVVRNAFEEGGHPYAQARQIRALENFGLTTRQNRAVMNFRGSQAEAGLTGAKLDKVVERYRKKLLRYRSENIARTETIRASEAGHQEAWRQAADAGFFDTGSARRKWVITPDDRLCPECRSVPGLNPEGVGLEQDFNTPFGPRPRPPLHPHCRCSVVMEFSDTP